MTAEVIVLTLVVVLGPPDCVSLPIFSANGSVNHTSGVPPLASARPWGLPPAEMIGYSKKTFVPGTYFPILSLLYSVNQMLTMLAGVAVVTSTERSLGSALSVGILKVTYSPVTGFSLPMLLLRFSVTHTYPLGSTPIPHGPLLGVIE